MDRPLNFFILGAPKCGTTSLYHYLRAHPQIFMPSTKEHHYYASDFPDLQQTTSRERYRAHFAKAPTGSLVGEASTWYLFSDVAVPRILEEHPDAKLIACVRNPIEMAPSVHGQLVYRLREDVEDFETAWRLQAARRQGRSLPPSLEATKMVQYGEVCKLGAQVQRVLERAGDKRVKVVVSEDLKRDPRGTYEDILRFLDVANDGRTEFPRYNENKVSRSKLLARLMMRPPKPLKVVHGGARFLLERLVDRPGDKIRAWCTKKAERPPLSRGLRSELVAYFDENIALMESLTGRKLDHWRHAGGSVAEGTHARSHL
jgi:hypothetical protein